MNREKIEKMARDYAKKLHAKFNDPRYKKVIGKFVAVGLLEHNKIPAFRGRVTLEDVLWVGDIEPRVLELLPAILLRRPKMIDVQMGIPDDLRQVVIELRRAAPVHDFRDVPPSSYAPWVERIGRKPTAPSILKTFRFQRGDVDKLNFLKQKMGLSEMEILRMALQKL